MAASKPSSCRIWGNKLASNEMRSAQAIRIAPSADLIPGASCVLGPAVEARTWPSRRKQAAKSGSSRLVRQSKESCWRSQNTFFAIAASKEHIAAEGMGSSDAEATSGNDVVCQGLSIDVRSVLSGNISRILAVRIVKWQVNRWCKRTSVRFWLSESRGKRSIY
jgi:hypothetical protein